MIKKSNERGGMIGGTEGDTLSSLLIYLVYFKPEIALSQSTKHVCTGPPRTKRHVLVRTCVQVGCRGAACVMTEACM